MRRFSMIALLLALGTTIIPSQQTTQPTGTTQPTAEPTKDKIIPPIGLTHVVPEYPESVRAKHINGRCAASLTVDVNGSPQDIKLIRCSNPIFVDRFLASLSQNRYKPAMQYGKPVAVEISEMISVQFPDAVDDTAMLIRYGFKSPPGTTSSNPDTDGVYPLTTMVTLPSMVKFSDKGYSEAAFRSIGNSVCDIVLTIDAKGKASDPVVTHCERPALEKPAVDSLLNSKYKPGKVNGKAVAIRASIHLEYGDLPPKP